MSVITPSQLVFKGDGLPFSLPLLNFGPKMRVAVQIVLTAVVALVYYSFYRSAPGAIEATGHNGFSMPPNTVIPTWFFIVVPLLSIVPAVYTFLFLRYNFLQ